MVLALLAIGGLGLAAGLLVLRRRLVPSPNFDGVFIPGTTPVIVAVTNALPSKDLDVVIKRRANVRPNDVILVRPRALEPEVLAQAVETLRTTRREFGRLPNADAIIRADYPGSSQPPRVAEGARWVASLRSVRPMHLPGVGNVRMIGLHLYDWEIGRP